MLFIIRILQFLGLVKSDTARQILQRNRRDTIINNVAMPTHVKASQPQQAQQAGQSPQVVANPQENQAGATVGVKNFGESLKKSMEDADQSSVIGKSKRGHASKGGGIMRRLIRRSKGRSLSK